MGQEARPGPHRMTEPGRIHHPDLEGPGFLVPESSWPGQGASAAGREGGLGACAQNRWKGGVGRGPLSPTCTWPASGAGKLVPPCTLGSRYMQVGSSTWRDALPP